ncbi:unnamed protein product [Caenorhabditis bovis]|uniref:Saposin B-type domain-containing protein n=1 Tax=Caenorhabditis bovis TaxID=2654633 RepID=A0A8S1F4S2_9PELO|nr:unnamed protein product [Caenorhabditis bovis]
MQFSSIFAAFAIISIVYGAKLDIEKPLCDLCLKIVDQLDETLKHGDDVEKAVHKFCEEDVPSFLVDTCDKVIAKNLDFIIEKLKDHEEGEKICSDIYLCKTLKSNIF